MRLLFFVYYGSLIFCFSSCYPVQEVKERSDQQTKELAEYFAKVHTQRLLALEKEDVETFIAFYTEEAALFDIGATAIGKKNIRQHVQNVLSSMSIKNTKNVQKEVEISGDLAYDYGTTSMELHYIYDGHIEEVTSKYVAIWHRQSDGKWKIVKLIFNQEG